MHNTNTDRDLAVIKQELAEAVRLLRLIAENTTTTTTKRRTTK